jgi:DNA (cytosine-5)-methyltransferase 1
MGRFAYYNEIDPFKAEVIRQAMKAGAITEGEVDERSIVDVRAEDLRGFQRCHAFAGGAFWDLALNQAGWGDAEVWTGSCPCPSFSVAGKGAGFNDPRHLWPEWFRLIRECRPRTVFGEQVNAAIGHGWLDLVSCDLEAEGYAIASAVVGAHSVGGPHRRQRLYFGAHAMHSDWREIHGHGSDGRHGQDSGRQEARSEPGTRSEVLDSADADGSRCGQGRAGQEGNGPRSARQQPSGLCAAGNSSNADGRQSGDRDVQRSGELGLFAQDCGPGFDHYSHSDRRKQSRNNDGDDERFKPSSTSSTGHSADITGRGFGVDWSASGEAGHAALADSVGERTNTSGTRPWELSRRRIEPARSSESDRPLRDWRGPGWLDPLTARSVAARGATRGFWADCDWWYGRDGKYRPIGAGITPLVRAVKRGVFTLADGRTGGVGQVCDRGGEGFALATAEERAGRLRLYGDAICVPLAAEFIAAFGEASEMSEAKEM